jgi:DNA-binding CsgD family transcriptional regulator
MVMPVNCARADSLATPQGCAILFVTQPGEPPRLDTEAVAQAFGLTPRQAMLAVLLARGASLAQAAAALKVTVETARWHLKEIFERTNTHRQADLVRLLCKAFESSFKS